MKVLVFSDSHGRTQPMLDLVAQESPDAVFHLGDHSRDADVLRFTFPDLPLYRVSGNCDLFGGALPPEDVTFLGGKTVFYLHGHTRHVKSGLREARAQGKALLADLVLYGHTHIPDRDEEDGLLLVNPGALQNGRYAVLRWEADSAIDVDIRLLP